MTIYNPFRKTIRCFDLLPDERAPKGRIIHTKASGSGVHSVVQVVVLQRG